MKICSFKDFTKTSCQSKESPESFQLEEIENYVSFTISSQLLTMSKRSLHLVEWKESVNIHNRDAHEQQQPRD